MINQLLSRPFRVFGYHTEPTGRYDAALMTRAYAGCQWLPIRYFQSLVLSVPVLSELNAICLASALAGVDYRQL